VQPESASEVEPIFYEDEGTDAFKYPEQAIAQQIMPSQLLPYYGMQVVSQIL
jgi:hypothetical protein